MPFELVTAFEHLPQEPSVMLFEEAVDGTKQLGALGFELPSDAAFHFFPGDFGFVFGQKLHQVAAGFPEQNGNHRIDFYVAGFQELMDLPLDVAKAVDEALAIPRQVSPLANDFGRNETGFDESHPQQLAIHWQSLMSVLRPGRFLMWRALTVLP
jgi:hypothetical protein